MDNSLVPQSLHNLIKRNAVEQTYFLEKARAETTLNSISDAVIGTDMAGNVDYLNIAAEAMTGWSREEAHGHPIGEVMRIIDGDTRKPKPNPVDLVLQHNEAMALTAGTILIRRDGHEAAIEDSAAPIRDWDGKMTGAVIVFHDVTACPGNGLENGASRATRFSHQLAQSRPVERPGSTSDLSGKTARHASGRPVSRPG
jgi:PAS domain S-box-containing protein